MRVLLVHGLGRTPLSLIGLARELRASGHAPKVVGYLAAVEPFDRIRRRVRSRLLAAARAGGGYAAIGHSLGGLILRSALIDWPTALPRPAHLFTLGSPTRAPLLASRFRKQLWYRTFTGECGRLLADPAFFRGLGAPPIPLTVMAGTRGWRGPRSPFRHRINDGVVALDETAVAGSTTIEVSAWHTWLMNHRAARNVIRNRLEHLQAP